MFRLQDWATHWREVGKEGDKKTGWLRTSGLPRGRWLSLLTPGERGAAGSLGPGVPLLLCQSPYTIPKPHLLSRPPTPSKPRTAYQSRNQGHTACIPQPFLCTSITLTGAIFSPWCPHSFRSCPKPPGTTSGSLGINLRGAVEDRAASHRPLLTD